MKSSNDSPTPARPPSGGTLAPITLRLRGLGPPPSHKNGDHIAGLRRVGSQWQGNPMIVRKKEHKQWMERAISAIGFMLSTESATRGFGTTPACLKRFVTALLPLDDNWQELEIGSVKTILVDEGEEGCDIVIEAVD